MFLRKLAVTSLFLLLMALSVLFSGCINTPVIKPAQPTVAEPIIRVKIFDAAPSVPVAVSGGFTIQNSDRKIVYQGPSLPNTNLMLQGNRLVIGSQQVPFGEYCDIVPNQDGILAVNYRYYHGSLRLHKTSSGQLYAVNHVRAEEYLKGVLPGEMPKRFSMEAFKAQAVAARTFALYEKATLPGKRAWDVMDNESSQMYIGRSGETQQCNMAVQATRGIVLTADIPGHGRKIFPAYFSSTCGGWTEPAVCLANIDPNIKPLQGGVKCDGCAISPHRNWTDKRVSLEDVRNSINSRCLSPVPLQQISSIRVLQKTRQGFIWKVEVTDITGRSVTIPGQKFRLTVGSRKMPSTFCDLHIEGSDLVFDNGHGLGHGCGMCQWGAEGMARQGYTAKEILLHYYPGAQMVRAY
jgi:stage II sporulation protein D